MTDAGAPALDPPAIEDDGVVHYDERSEKEPILPAHKGPITNADEALDAIGYGPFQTKMFILCSATAFIDSSESTIISLLFPLLKDYWKLEHWELGAIGSSTYLGMLLGALILGRLSDQVGRRPIFLLALFTSSLFAIMSALAPNIYWFWVFRGLLGFGYGGSCVSDIVILAEFLPTKNRGVYLAAVDLVYSFGTVYIAVMAWLLVPSIGWRWLLVISGVPGIVLVILRRNIPESPRFLLMRGREKEATKVLIQVAKENHCAQEVIDRLEDSKMTDEEYEEEMSHAFDLTSYGKLFNPLLLLTTVTLTGVWFFFSFGAVLQQWLPLYMSEKSGKKVGFMDDAYRAAIMQSAGDVLGAAIAVYLVHALNRRICIRIGIAVMAAIAFGLVFVDDMMTLLIFLMFFGLSRVAVSGLLYTYTPEVYPTTVRSTGMGLCAAFHRLAPLLGHALVGIFLQYSFSAVIMGFSAIFLIAFTMSLLLPYETKDQPLASHYYQDYRAAHPHSQKPVENGHQA